MTKDTGGPAFPFEEKHADGTHYHTHGGMTLRDYFAAKAMQGFLASPNATQDWINKHGVRSSWSLADAMLAERNKE